MKNNDWSKVRSGLTPDDPTVLWRRLSEPPNAALLLFCRRVVLFVRRWWCEGGGAMETDHARPAAMRFLFECGRRGGQSAPIFVATTSHATKTAAREWRWQCTVMLPAEDSVQLGCGVLLSFCRLGFCWELGQANGTV